MTSKILFILVFIISIFSCGLSADQYNGVVNYTLINHDTLDINKIDRYIRIAIEDFSSIENLNEEVFVNNTVTIEYHKNNAWLCRAFESQTCMVYDTKQYYIEINTDDTPYSKTYHEWMHFLLTSHNIGEQHEWMRSNKLCQKWERIGGTYCKDVPFKL